MSPLIAVVPIATGLHHDSKGRPFLVFDGHRHFGARSVDLLAWMGMYGRGQRIRA